jgi:hypothetical protein
LPPFQHSAKKVERDSGIERRRTILYKSTQLLGYADNTDIIRRSEKAITEAFVIIETVGENIDTLKKNTIALLDASKEVGLEVNPEKTKYMLVSRCQKAVQRQNIKIGNRSFKSLWKSSNIWEQHLQIKIVFMKR